MARSTPSLLALLGIAAVAGYKNRDKLGDMLGSATAGTQGRPAAEQSGGITGLLGSLGGGGLAGGIGELLDRFGASGHRDRAESWVAPGTNHAIDQTELESALGDETIEDLMATTGLSRSDILERLSQNLPETVDRFTPHGRIPTEDEANSLL